MALAGLLEGKKVLVTAGAAGIGKAIALRFAEQGAAIAIADLDRHKGQATLDELRKWNSSSLFVHADFSNRRDTESALQTVLQKMGRIDVLVNGVGIPSRKPMHEIEEEEWDRVFDTNLKSMYRCCRACIPGMIEAGGGAIVNISSINGLATRPQYDVYSATKGAMLAATKAMALSYAQYGIRVNAICPGLIMSSTVSQEVEENPNQAAFMEKLNGMQPLGRPGTPEEIADGALFLASSMSSFVTGTYLLIDGGALAQAH